MANCVINELTIKNISEEEKRKIFLSILNNKGEFDFNKIIPSPKELQIEESNFTEYGVALIENKIPKYVYSTFEEWKENIYKSYNKNDIQRMIDLGNQAITNYQKYGHYTWYTFNYEFWGTRSNAGNTQLSGLCWYSLYESKSSIPPTIYKKRILKKRLKKIENPVLTFNTYNGMAKNIFIKLSEKYPKAIFCLKYANEDKGRDCGIFNFQNGDVVFSDYSPSSLSNGVYDPKWTEFAFRFWYGDDEDPESYGYGEDWVYSEDVEEQYYEKQKIKQKVENFD